MKNTMGIILTGGRNNRLKEISECRSISAVPVGGKYRAIDFVLSNMVNSGIISVGVLTQYSFRSLVDHLGSGREWDLDRKKKGLFIFPPYLSGNDSGWYKGTADAMYNNLTYLKRSDEEYVIISHGNCIYKMAFDDLLEYHTYKGADITIVYREMNDYPPHELPLLGIVSVGDDGKILDFEEKPMHPKTNLASAGIYIMKRSLLIALLEECVAHGNYDLVKDIIIKKLGILNIYGYRLSGYWRNLSSIQLYYRCNMELLNPNIRYQLFTEEGKIYTKVKDETPAKYNFEADVKNSIVGDGCIIEGCVENSVLFRGVTVKKGAVVKDSIIMQGTVIEEDAMLQYAILDKNVVLTSGKHLKGEPTWPITIGKNIKV